MPDTRFRSIRRRTGFWLVLAAVCTATLGCARKNTTDENNEVAPVEGVIVHAEVPAGARQTYHIYSEARGKRRVDVDVEPNSEVGRATSRIVEMLRDAERQRYSMPERRHPREVSHAIVHLARAGSEKVVLKSYSIYEPDLLVEANGQLFKANADQRQPLIEFFRYVHSVYDK